MAEVLELEVKSNIGEATSDAKGLASEFQFMGVSLNSLNAGFASMAKVAKASFATVRAGMISTGIGALVVGIGSLVAWFTKTKKGAEALTRVFTGISAAVNVIVDRISKFGGAIAKLFSGDVKGAFNEMKGTLSGIGDEMVREIQLAVELEAQLQGLVDRERDLNVETAQRRAEIEELKMVAEDVTKSEEERLDAAERAFEIENNLLQARVANAEEAVRIQQQQMELSENMAADLDELAQKEIALATIRQESATKQIELNNKINAIKAQTEAKEKAAYQRWVQRENSRIAKQNQTVISFNKMRREEALKTLTSDRAREITQANWKRDEREKLIMDTVRKGKLRDKLIAENFTFHQMELDRIEDKWEDIREENRKKKAADLLAIQNETIVMEIENERMKADKLLEIQKELELKEVEGRTDTEVLKAAIEDKYRAIHKKKDDKRAKEDKDRDDAVNKHKEQAFMNVLGAVGALAGENSALGKGVAAAQIVYNTQQGIMAAMGATSVADKLLPYPVRLANAIATGVMGAIALKKVMSTDPMGGGASAGGGGGGAVSAGATAPSSQMMSGTFDISGGEAPEAMRAYVVTDEMSNSQNQLANIRRRATI